MASTTLSTTYTPEDVERASERDGKHYELIDGDLREKVVGTESLFIAGRISERLNSALYPDRGFAVVEAMIYCFGRPNHGRRPDVMFVRRERVAEGRIPKGDLRIAPDLVVEVLSPGNTGLDLEEKINEYLTAGVLMVWIVNPERKTMRVYRSDGTTRLFRANETIANEPLLPGFGLEVGEIFPE